MKNSEKRYTKNFWQYKTLSIALVSVALISSCEWIQVKKNHVDQSAQQPIARVHEKFLYKKDIEGIVPKGSGSLDSANVVNRYIQNWIKKQLMITEASSNIEFNKVEIERKILDYQYALMVYEFEKRHVFLNLDKEVTQKEVEDYYQKNKDNFPLKQNIVRCVFLQIPSDSPKLKDIKKAITGRSESAKSQLKSLSLRHAMKTHLEDTIWLKFDDVFSSVPLTITNRVQFLKENKDKVVEVANEHSIYLIHIYDFKAENEISPLDYVKEDIETIIINRRKTMLARQLEEDIYNKALKNKNFEIYVEN